MCIVYIAWKALDLCCMAQDMGWYVMAWDDMPQYYMVQDEIDGMVWHGAVWYGMAWYGMVLDGMVLYRMDWDGMGWHGLVLCV